MTKQKSRTRYILPRPLMRPVVLEIQAWLETALDGPLPLADVAARAGYSVWHFQRAFRQVTGYSPANYIRTRKMTQAAALLRTTPLPVADLCEAVGVEEITSFNRCFRRVTGMSPSAYRLAAAPTTGWELLPFRHPAEDAPSRARHKRGE